MHKRQRLKVAPAAALGMITSYASSRIIEQIKSLSFIVIYLLAFQTIILGTPPEHGGWLAAGIGMVVFGLAFFLEGILIGIMPLGERVGVLLPKKSGIIVIAFLGILVGFGSTIAEPAIAVLRMTGGTIKAWNSPLLFALLERYTEELVIVIGAGVGIAVGLGMLRFHYGLSIKPFIFIIIPVLLLLSILLSKDENLSGILGLAWDAGAVTTGAVTVPLVMAIGIGVSRASGSRESDIGGFGVIMLASALPIMAVMMLGLYLNSLVPEPASETVFFNPENRENSLRLFESEEDLLIYAFTKGTEAGRRAFFENPEDYNSAINSLTENKEDYKKFLGSMTLIEWISKSASENEIKHFSPKFLAKMKKIPTTKPPMAEIFSGGIKASLKAILPLTALLLIVLLIFLKDKPRYTDELIFGIFISVLGMAVLTSGIGLGLAPMGDEVGRKLPRAFRSDPEYAGRIVIENFDTDLIFESISEDGTISRYFYYNNGEEIYPIPFIEEQYSEQFKTYDHIISRPPLFKPGLTILGIGLVCLFAFGLGYGSTVAEPALNALGLTVEQLTVGTVNHKIIIRVVAFGVGAGLVMGVVRILYDLPIVWLLTVSYGLTLILTCFNDKGFSAIAWDCGGVTTGPVTVPLVLAMGLGIGAEMDIGDGFGILSLASLFPILAVLIYGIIIRIRSSRTIHAVELEKKNE